MCRQIGSGWRWPSRWAWWWVLVLCFSLWFGPFAGAQNVTDSEPSEKQNFELSLSDSLNLADSSLQMLLLRLSERKQEVEQLRVSLSQAAQSLSESSLASEELQTRLKAAEAAVSELQMDLRATLISLAGARTQYDMLSEAFGAYVAETQEQKREIISERDQAMRQARLMRIGLWLVGPVIVVETIALIVSIIMLVRR